MYRGCVLAAAARARVPPHPGSVISKLSYQKSPKNIKDKHCLKANWASLTAMSCWCPCWLFLFNMIIWDDTCRWMSARVTCSWMLDDENDAQTHPPSHSSGGLGLRRRYSDSERSWFGERESFWKLSNLVWSWWFLHLTDPDFKSWWGKFN